MAGRRVVSITRQTAEGSESSSARDRCKARNSGSRARTLRLNWPWEQSFGKYSRRCAQAKRQKSRSLLKRGHWARMARVMTSGSVSKAGRPTLGGSEECLSFHQSSTNTYNETKKESRSSMAPSFGESLVHQHTILAPSRFFAITHQTSKVSSFHKGADLVADPPSCTTPSRWQA